MKSSIADWIAGEFKANIDRLVEQANSGSGIGKGYHKDLKEGRNKLCNGVKKLSKDTNDETMWESNMEKSIDLDVDSGRSVSCAFKDRMLDNTVHKDRLKQILQNNNQCISMFQTLSEIAFHDPEVPGGQKCMTNSCSIEDQIESAS